MSKSVFGVCEKGTVYAYTIKNANGMEATILSMGGIIQKLQVPVNGSLVDVVLGYDTLEEYLANSNYFGALIGRNGNRIAGAEFTLNGTRYQLVPNNGPHNLHGGREGFDRKLWEAEENGQSLVLKLFSPDGEEGYPGNVQVTVTYTLEDDNGLRIDYKATTDQDTILNMTNHSYFNLNGGGPITDHTLWVDCDVFTVNDDYVVPTGEIRSVEGTCMDFRQPKKLGQDINAPMLAKALGYDNNFCLNGEGLRKVATLQGEALAMDVETTLPGMQIYCADLVRPMPGKNGTDYVGRCFTCLETQGYPDAIHHENFPSNTVKAGETYHEVTVYRFR